MEKSLNLVGRDQLLNLRDGDIGAGYAQELCNPNLKRRGEGHHQGERRGRTRDN